MLVIITSPNARFKVTTASQLIEKETNFIATKIIRMHLDTMVREQENSNKILQQ